MMNRNELRELMKRLEALEALAKLFNNLWFERIREDVKDTKVQAYLTVFDDAFPHMNHVIEFVRRSAELLSVGDAGQEQWARLHSEFDYLHRLLNQPEEMLASVAPPAPPADDEASELSFEEREALKTVDQSDIDSLFVDTDAEPDVEGPSDDIDALFDTSDDVEEEMDEQAMDALFAEESAEDSITGEMITDDEEAAPEAQAILEDAGNGEADATASTQELEELLEGVDEEDVAEEDVQRSDLLDGEVESDDDGIAEILDEAPTPEPAPEDKESADLDEGLFVDEDDNAADDDAEDDDLGELFEGEDEAEEEEDEEIDLGDILEEEDEEVGEANGPGISADEMNVLLEEGDESSDGEEEEEEDEESSISEDEIDALFG